MGKRKGEMGLVKVMFQWQMHQKWGIHRGKSDVYFCDLKLTQEEK